MKNRVTIEDVQENMKDVLVETRTEFGKPVTYVTVRMKNGFTLRESTTCVDPTNYDEKVGEDICLERIESKVWFLLGYQLQEDMYRQSSQEKSVLEKLTSELQALTEREKKLKAFVLSNNSETCKNVTPYHVALLEAQRIAMEWYHEVLADRIEDIKNNEK